MIGSEAPNSAASIATTIAEPVTIQKNSTVRSGTSARSSMRPSQRHCFRLPNALSVTRKTRRQHLEPLLLARELRVHLVAADVRGDPAAHPRAADAGEDEQDSEQDEERDGDGDAERAAGAVGALRDDLRRRGLARCRRARDRDRCERRALADRPTPRRGSGRPAVRRSRTRSATCAASSLGDRRVDAAIPALESVPK